MTSNYSPKMLLRAHTLRVTPAELARWDSVPAFGKHDSNAVLRVALGAYRQNRVPAAYVRELLASPYGASLDPFVSYDAIIDCHRLHSEGIPMDYYSVLIKTGAAPDDILRFFHDGVPADYALSLLQGR